MRLVDKKIIKHIKKESKHFIFRITTQNRSKIFFLHCSIIFEKYTVFNIP